jgi:translation initiation factor IF-3
LSYPHSSRHSSSASTFVRVNGKIRAREVRVIGEDSKQIGILSLAEAISMARAQGVDLVEIVPNATPPVCRIVDFGKYRYEQAKKEKESKKHQHANKVKEVQLSPHIDPHDFSVKLSHAVDFLCEDMKVKVTLKFRGREMAHQEFGFQQVNKLLQEVAAWGHADFTPKLAGRSIHVMISPLPRNKRGPHPKEGEHGAAPGAPPPPPDLPGAPVKPKAPPPSPAPAKAPDGFANNPFAGIDLAQSEAGLAG